MTGCSKFLRILVTTVYLQAGTESLKPCIVYPFYLFYTRLMYCVSHISIVSITYKKFILPLFIFSCFLEFFFLFFFFCLVFIFFKSGKIEGQKLMVVEFFVKIVRVGAGEQ